MESRKISHFSLNICTSPSIIVLLTRYHELILLQCLGVRPREHLLLMPDFFCKLISRISSSLIFLGVQVQFLDKQHWCKDKMRYCYMPEKIIFQVSHPRRTKPCGNDQGEQNTAKYADHDRSHGQTGLRGQQSLFYMEVRVPSVASGQETQRGRWLWRKSLYFNSKSSTNL